ncbi:MAG: cupin domain-containing protein [Deltaproteobacteria bacterium]|nr:cupin domain-containing protein [Deltaproteobacteria bacterium]
MNYSLFPVLAGIASMLALAPMLSPAFAQAAEAARFVRPQQTTTYIEPNSKSTIRVLIDEKLGGTKEVSIAELIIPPGVDVPDHVHQATEIFYILSGELEQTSEGKVQKLTAGMTALVPANTTTHHKVTSKKPVRALVIWAPGGEEQRIVERWQKK